MDVMNIFFEYSNFHFHVIYVQVYGHLIISAAARPGRIARLPDCQIAGLPDCCFFPIKAVHEIALLYIQD